MYVPTSGIRNTDFEPAKAGERRPRASVPMYVAAFIVTACGLVAASLNLGDASFTNLTLTLSLIGTLVSFISRKQNIAPKNVEAPAIIVCVLLCGMAIIDPVLPFLAPARGIDDRSQSLVVFLTWLVVFRSFTLISEGMLLFCCVPTLALIGLVSTMTTDPIVVTTFIVYVAASVFMMVHETYLRTQPVVTRYRPATLSGMLFGSQLQIAAICALGATALANLVAVPMRNLGQYMMFSAAISPPGQMSCSASSTTRVSVEEKTDLRVGTGPVHVSNEVLLRVKAQRGANWRGGSFDQYTGRGWKSTIERSKLIATDAPRDADGLLDDSARLNALYTFKIPVPGPYRSVRSHPLVQQVQIVAGQFSEIYGAAEPTEIRMTEERAERDDGGGIHLLRSIQSTRYEITSDVADWTEDSLRTAPTRYPDDVKRLYLQLPRVDPAAVAQLHAAALKVTGGQKTVYDRVKALQDWIGQECKYNTDTPAFPPDQDVASYFLFTEQQGYCDSFATALTVLCRTIGVPARVASGFLAGELDPQTGEYAVREKDKHLWTEVYFPGAGWVSFDATENAIDASGQGAASRSGKRGSIIAWLFQRGWLPPTILLAVVCMFLYVLKVEVFDRIRPRKSIRTGLDLPATNLAIVDAYMAACAILAHNGLARNPAETPHEYRERMTSRLTAVAVADDALDRLTALVVRFRYSPATATEEDVRLARTAVGGIRQALRGANRKRLVADPAAAST